MFSIAQRAFDGSVDLGAGLRLFVSLARNFEFERDFSGAEPRAGIQQLYLDGGAGRRLRAEVGGGQFPIERARTHRFDNGPVLVFYQLANFFGAWNEFRGVTV